jgi:hypothetical protein
MASGLSDTWVNSFRSRIVGYCLCIIHQILQLTIHSSCRAWRMRRSSETSSATRCDQWRWSQACKRVSHWDVFLDTLFGARHWLIPWCIQCLSVQFVNSDSMRVIDALLVLHRLCSKLHKLLMFPNHLMIPLANVINVVPQVIVLPKNVVLLPRNLGIFFLFRDMTNGILYKVKVQTRTFIIMYFCSSATILRISWFCSRRKSSLSLLKRCIWAFSMDVFV